MKNSFKTFAAAAAAVLALAGCQKIGEGIQETSKVSFVANSIQTKTAFGTPDGTTYPTLWTANDSKVKVTLNLINEKATDALVHVSSDCKTASFEIELKQLVPEEAPQSYAFTVVSPASALVGFSTTKGPNVNIPASQTPSETSVDEAAQILVATSKSYTSLPTTEVVSLDFEHVTAYGQISLTSLPEDAAIQKITMSAESNWAGRWNYLNGAVAENSASANITINTTRAAGNWFACAPVDLGGKTLKVTVTTDKGDFVKTVKFPAGKKFESGKIAKFSVDFAGITPAADVYYTLVKNTDELTVGSQVIIAALGSDKALGSTQNNNNRAAADITKLENGSKIKNPSTDVQIITLEKGTKTKTAAFNVGTGYLYAASGSSNHLKTQTTNNDNGSFEVTSFAPSTGSIQFKSVGSNSRNLLRYNTSGLFSCYGQGQSDVVVYKKEGSGTTEKIFGTVDSIPEFASMAELCAAGLESGTVVTVTLTDEEITRFYTSSSEELHGVYFMVGTQEVEIYCKTAVVPSTWQVGGKISGTVTCAWSEYKGTWELTPSDWSAFSYK